MREKLNQIEDLLVNNYGEDEREVLTLADAKKLLDAVVEIIEGK